MESQVVPYSSTTDVRPPASNLGGIVELLRQSARVTLGRQRAVAERVGSVADEMARSIGEGILSGGVPRDVRAAAAVAFHLTPKGIR